jgi:hypothetical protein
MGCSLVVQGLPSMREALGSILAPKKKRQKKKELQPSPSQNAVLKPPCEGAGWACDCF